MMKPTYLMLTMTALILAAAGCSSVPETYVPMTVGPVHNSIHPGQGLHIQIHTPSDYVAFGEPVEFTVTVRNEGDTSYWVPSNPDVLFVWTFPNGRRDNFLRDEPRPQFFTEYDAIQLHPGQQMVRQMKIKTHYFDLDGVTEFRAILNVAANTNPELTPFWTGRAVSNGYGVMMANARKIAGYQVSQSASRVPNES